MAMVPTAGGADDARPAITPAPHASPFYAVAKVETKGKGKASHPIEVTDDSDEDAGGDDNDSEPDICLICLRSDIQDRSILPACLHSLFCFECILQWAQVKRCCPLCNRPLGDYILHNVRNDSDYSRHFLRPPKEESELQPSASNNSSASSAATAAALARRRRLPIRPRDGERSGWTEWAPSGSGASEEATEAAVAEHTRSIERRRLVYREGLYAKHIGNNRYSGFRPPPSPRDITTQPHHLERLTPFLHRELYALPLPPDSLDVEFLMTYISSIFKTMHVRSEGAVRLLAEFFGSRALAEHFTHEVMTFCRSPARDCRGFDKRVEYDWPWRSGGVAGLSRREAGRGGMAEVPGSEDDQESAPHLHSGEDDQGSSSFPSSHVPSPSPSHSRPPASSSSTLLSRLEPRAHPSSLSLLSRISGNGDVGGGDGDGP